MKKVYITFSGAQYHHTTQRLVDGATKFGADEVLVYDDHWLRTCRPDFMAQLTPLLNHRATRGYGWFAWKPFIILDALRRVGPDDVVFFTDADTYPIHDLGIIFEIGQRDGIMLFSAVGHTQRMWCKRDCSILMGQDEDHWLDRPHGVARFMAFTQRQAPFLDEWQRYCLDIRATTFDPSVLGPERPGFHQHRCEQAIMTNLAHKYGHHLHREACEFGNSVPNEKDIYPQLFIQDGSHSWDPNSRRPGSSFCNVHD